MPAIPRIRITVAPILSVLITTSCLRSVAITELPIHGETPSVAAARLTRSASENRNIPINEDDTKYWSAFVHMEAQDLVDRWGVQWGDYVLVSAQVKIPTRNAPIVRNFPLFLIEHGQVQTQSGVDLLKKIPISTHAREQVSITLEARYIKGSRYLDITKKILKEASRAAEPFLNAYPIASQIIGTAIPMLDQILPKDDKRTPSSRTIMIEAHNLPGAQGLLAFILVPTKLPAGKQEKTAIGPNTLNLDTVLNEEKEAECGLKASNAIPRSLACARLVECSDHPGMLCRYQSIKAYKTEVQGALDALSKVPKLTRDQIRLQRKRDRRQSLEDRIDEIQFGQPTFYVSSELSLLTTELDVLKQSIAADETVLGVDANIPVRVISSSKGTFAPYQTNRVRDAAYITIDFRSYENVWDPMLMLRDARSECASLNAGSIKQARDYLTANEDLFLARDVDLAKTQFGLAEGYLKLRANLEKRDFGAVMANLDDLLLVHGYRSPQSPLPEFKCVKGDPLCAHYNTLFQCTESILQTAPLEYVYRVWLLYHGLRGEDGERRDRCPDLATDDAFRLDLLDRALSDFAHVAGDAYDYRGTKFKSTSSSPLPIQVAGHMVKQLDAEAKALLETQQGSKPFPKCNNFKDFQFHSGTLSLACSDCWSKLAKKCGVSDAEVANARAIRQRAVEDQLITGRGSLCGPF